MDILEKIYKAGVVGAGGAGFPTHIKYKSKADKILINAAECEPLLHTDQYEMETYSDEIIQGILLAKDAVGAREAVIGIKAKHEKSVEALEKSIRKLGAPIQIHKMESFYPAGDEHGLIYEVFGIALDPGSIPISKGIVVSNSTTVKNVYESTKDQAVTRKTVTVNGEIGNPCVIDVPIGTSIKQCIEAAGGTKLSSYAVILGGPMMGKMIMDSDVDTTFVTKTTGGVIILGKDHPLITRRLQSLKKIKNQTASACIQCDFCTELCPRYLIGHPLHPHEVMKSFGNDGDLQAEKLLQADLCCECGICELYSCPMGLSPRIVNAEVKKILRKSGIPKKEFTSMGVHPLEEYRKLSTDVLAKKIAIDKYYKVHDFDYFRLDSKEVTIPLSQHIGKPAEAMVKPGDRVEMGQMIGQVSIEEMGACIHSSIDGEVVDVGPVGIKIKASDNDD